MSATATLNPSLPFSSSAVCPKSRVHTAEAMKFNMGSSLASEVFPFKWTTVQKKWSSWSEKGHHVN